MKLASDNVVLPWTVVSTEYQSKGRGQRNNAWFSSRNKNLLCSIFIKPSVLPPTEQFYLNIILSLAVFDSVDEIIGGGRTKIKWPNDIYVDDHKVAGLLIHNTLQGHTIAQSILGIGLNINEMKFPTELNGASSLFLKTGRENDIQSILDKMTDYLKANYNELSKGNFQKLHEAYTQKLYRLNEIKSFLDNQDNPFEGKIMGINKSGQLKIDVEGNARFFSMKEVRFVH